MKESEVHIFNYDTKKKIETANLDIIPRIGDYLEVYYTNGINYFKVKIVVIRQGFPPFIYVDINDSFNIN